MISSRVNSFQEILPPPMTTRSSLLAWKVPRTEEPGGAVHGSQRAGHDGSDLALTRSVQGAPADMRGKNNPERAREWTPQGNPDQTRMSGEMPSLR